MIHAADTRAHMFASVERSTNGRWRAHARSFCLRFKMLPNGKELYMHTYSRRGDYTLLRLGWLAGRCVGVATRCGRWCVRANRMAGGGTQKDSIPFQLALPTVLGERAFYNIKLAPAVVAVYVAHSH